MLCAIRQAIPRTNRTPIGDPERALREEGQGGLEMGTGHKQYGRNQPSGVAVRGLLLLFPGVPRMLEIPHAKTGFFGAVTRE